MQLAALGWSDFFQQQLTNSNGLTPARVSSQHRGIYRVLTAEQEMVATVSGRLRQIAAGPQDFPVVGDWVLVSPRPEERRATIQCVLERRTKFSRRAPGRRTEEQVLAANLDTVFAVTSLDGDFSVRRLEHYLLIARENGIAAVVLLNKSDLCDAQRRAELAAQAALAGAPVHVISSHRGDGLDAIAPYLQPGKTVALLGSSGVGKSTLVNRLMGRELLRTAPVRAEDSKGRHTTSHRQMVLLPSGVLVVDTPGMRELQLWAGEDACGAAFDDIERIAAGCRFRDCRHADEPGCAVAQAVADGALDPGRLENFHKAQKELRYLATQQDYWAALAEKRRWKAIHKLVRDYHPRG